MGKYGWLDSHAHLSDDTLFDRIDEVLTNCDINHVDRILTICLTFEELGKAFMLQEKDARIDIAMGLFPTDTHLHTEENFKKLEEVAKDPRIVAIGEMGLDYYWEKDPIKKEAQKEVFKRQIEIAKKVNKPILVHSRDAAKDTYDLLKEMNHYGVMHCYSYSVEYAREIIKLGYTISLAGPVTFKNAKEPKAVAKDVPLDKLLIETDSPYLTPEPHRGEKNEPAYVKHVGEYICELRDMNQEELQQAIHENYNQLFLK
ncbi:MAG: TatD family hydrolase [Anaerorhabdus sp.]|uniref:TatD family hydrolase n=1 Tax=Anaerorhabdus sp. TaxID=1872524 RepID=UPI002FC68626